MTLSIDAKACAQLFTEARTHNAWQDKPVSDEILQQLYDLLKWAPTSANAAPARFIFVKSPEAKAKLKPSLSEGNVEKTMSAPVTVIVAHDLEFYEQLPSLFPQADAKSWFAGNEAAINSTVQRNGSLQGAYLIMAARALGLDCGPMSGFDQAKVDEIFFAGSQWRANFLINLGYGDKTQLYPRNPRLDFAQACRIE
ncbi:malonic semialdehyde reductase [Iodobacter fluviatilis]|uniref:Putative NADH dehydrogenase/NAD(P)H nitroreductase C1H71_12025 n=1 Tax=Iodobacter fluviatilis TaxID=537 RepID=A0A7G3GAH3_9NEIS|nr:malonic semialdehyde reductase [Iodobacter fluviatilis]QBC44189.1 malonic semialdehyde reductase [Iodobacter fluviatilis]